jgi:hypothetical protein
LELLVTDSDDVAGVVTTILPLPGGEELLYVFAATYPGAIG